jgi:hypothetical protein
MADSLPHHEVYTRLRPSIVHKGGVGVFAIKRIKKGQICFPADSDEMVWVAKNRRPNAPKSVRDLYHDFGVFRKGRCGCPTSFDRLTPAWYVNDSKTPNVRRDRGFDFIALRDIQPGEELTADYSRYSGPPE